MFLYFLFLSPYPIYNRPEDEGYHQSIELFANVQ